MTNNCWHWDEWEIFESGATYIEGKGTDNKQINFTLKGMNQERKLIYWTWKVFICFTAKRRKS